MLAARTASASLRAGFRFKRFPDAVQRSLAAFATVSEYSSLWWRLSRCDNPAAFSGGTIGARRLSSDESIAPLYAALLVAARRVQPPLNTYAGRGRDVA